MGLVGVINVHAEVTYSGIALGNLGGPKQAMSRVFEQLVIHLGIGLSPQNRRIRGCDPVRNPIRHCQIRAITWIPVFRPPISLSIVALPVVAIVIVKTITSVSGLDTLSEANVNSVASRLGEAEMELIRRWTTQMSEFQGRILQVR